MCVRAKRKVGHTSSTEPTGDVEATTWRQAFRGSAIVFRKQDCGRRLLADRAQRGVHSKGCASPSRSSGEGSPMGSGPASETKRQIAAGGGKGPSSHLAKRGRNPGKPGEAKNKGSQGSARES